MNGHIRVLRPVRRPEEEEANEMPISPIPVQNDCGSDLNSTSSSSNENNSVSQDNESEEVSVDVVNNQKISQKRIKSSSDTEYSQCSQPSNSLSNTFQRTSRPRRVIKRRCYAPASESDSSCNEGKKKVVRPRRTIKKCQYRESIESSDNNSVDDDKPKISISSRGRIRKITARARAFLRD